MTSPYQLIDIMQRLLLNTVDNDDSLLLPFRYRVVGMLIGYATMA